tara:strand:+ start:2895 stop:3962 length:1068 start_codon:yes stop_codon:yes gene_type:complete
MYYWIEKIKLILKMNKKFRIKTSDQAYIIAEISGNHNGNILNAIKLIDECKRIGANAVKIQTYEPIDITLNSLKKDFLINKSSPWRKFKNLWNLYSKAQTPFKWQEILFNHASKINIDIFSSPFSERAVDILEKLNCKLYKLASPEINHIPLIEKIAKTNKPLIISTGMANEKSIDYAIKVFRKFSKQQIILLKCNSSYPSPLNQVNLNAIPYMQKKYKTIIGLSDHTNGYEVPLASIPLGAKVIEKHICLSKKNKIDGFFSLNVIEFQEMIKKIRNIEIALGKKLISNTKKNNMGGRSIYFSKNIKKGEKITDHNIKVVRPSNGLHPKFYNNILGKKVTKNFFKGDRVLIKFVI